MKDIVNLSTVSELMDFYASKKPLHPLIAVVDLAEVGIPESMLGVGVNAALYSITMKVKTPGIKVKYGRTNIDFAEGCLYGLSPGQVMRVEESADVGEFEGWTLFFHPDLVSGSELAHKIKGYGFFSYETNEALHLSVREKETLNEIVRRIKEEYSSNIDEHSREVLISSISLMLNYIQRYYNRQFLTRKSTNTNILQKFERKLDELLNPEYLKEKGLPTVSFLAAELNLSPSYLTDLMKRETGKNVQEVMHYHLLEQAKNLLLSSDMTIAEISYELGFEYPPYFSRLFKKKTGMTPSAYRMSVN
ncbi:helix-turn-helix domain-containing protein [Aureibacter tunicatorum]|uniref:AraC-like DNA-binding protein n=1 Tax=Aureibacter tunicatorum TaxID=866807 RepID=A0AAE4BQM9_9BACT|nr:AraC family transcriptional regulator [Aureibacter tunicatorum]MDR6237746.1 AraC-like DNA-binding protein [Aureibacter tunicatorum]BDD02781.1 AraC family transcriptional regulator [Aureibacter tunicatorum]